jgi:two-component sensor histidine kinase
MLFVRPRRAPNLSSEIAAFRELSALLATDPKRAIQQFLDLASTLCRAGSSGLSLLGHDEKGEPIFRWEALAGAFAPYVGGTTPRGFSPCGLCLDRGSIILVSRPARVFRYFEAVEAEIDECLIVPVRGTDGTPVGTLWVIHHDNESRFDCEDARVLEDLSVQLTLALRLLQDAAAREAATQEVHHRVKNTLMATAAVLRLQAKAVASTEARAALEEALGRLGVLASVHELLYRAATRTGAIEMLTMLDRLIDAVRQSASYTDGRVTLRLLTDDGILLSPDTAVPLALVANEALTNACKHAFPDGRTGEVEVRLARGEGGALVLTVHDNGIGLPQKPRDGSLGLRLIRAFARQVGGVLTLTSDRGTTLTLVLPAASPGR